ncbi:MAG: formylglycine-generating enzyme family protein, partial [Kiritimatiellae bacterium]|nr:formylglycine-generating enzyme family protein [Kiritimatiellia bacterium]MBP5321185.1 formylglycine-generating enzyme family protein [Kiritimatiellia bacterium]
MRIKNIFTLGFVVTAITGMLMWHRSTGMIGTAWAEGEGHGERTGAVLSRQVMDVKTVTLARGVEMRFRWCPAGYVMMWVPAENQSRQVRIAKGFWIGETEVTQRQWDILMGDNQSYFTGDVNLPVEGVTWDDCQLYIDKVKSLTGQEVSLPTEAQWEYACRAGTSGDCMGDLATMAWFYGNSGAETHPVGSKKPNLWGIYDMLGNVSEWCRIGFESESGSFWGMPGEPILAGRSVLRGGSWISNTEACRSTYRYTGWWRGYSSNAIGFRLVCAAASNDEGKLDLERIEVEKKAVEERIAAERRAEEARAAARKQAEEARAAAEKAAVKRAEEAYIATRVASEFHKLTSKKAEQARIERLVMQRLSEIIKDEDDRKLRKYTNPPRVGDVKTVTLPGDVEMRFRWCPAGAFMMGGPEQYSTTQIRAHLVVISKGFWIGETEVTFRQWKSIMDPFNNQSPNPSDNCPMGRLTWNNCQRFIALFKSQTGLEVSLPTEAQWEYACRAGSSESTNVNLNATAWYSANSGNASHPVGLKKPNAWGIYDMLGNAWEWCQEWYHPWAYINTPVFDPLYPHDGTQGYSNYGRVIRGGNWESPEHHCLPYARRDANPRSACAGIRLVCPIPR